MSDVIQFPLSDDDRAKNQPGIMYEQLSPGMQYIVDRELQIYTDAPSIHARLIRLKQSITQAHAMLVDSKSELAKLEKQVEGMDIYPVEIRERIEELKDTISMLTTQLQGKIASVGLLKAKLEQMGDPDA